MTRGHRTVHRLLWPVLAVIVALGFTMALVLRPPPGAAGTVGAAEMSAGFQAVQWNRRKLVYDAILVAGVALFIGTFMTVGALRNPPADHAGLDRPAHQGVRHLRVRDADHHPDDRPARAARSRASCRCSTTAAISAC